jgi:hypothetical protein
LENPTRAAAKLNLQQFFVNRKGCIFGLSAGWAWVCISTLEAARPQLIHQLMILDVAGGLPNTHSASTSDGIAAPLRHLRLRAVQVSIL